MAALPFISTNEVQPTHIVYNPWYLHPPSIRCKCGIIMYPRVRQDASTYITRFECGDHKCQKVIIFIDSNLQKEDNSGATSPSRS